MVKVNTHARTQRYGEPAYNTSQKHHRITPTNHLSAMGAEIVLRLSMRAFRLPLLPPFFFLSLPPLFYLTLACTNYSIEEVREDRGGGGREICLFACSAYIRPSPSRPLHLRSMAGDVCQARANGWFFERTDTSSPFVMFEIIQFGRCGSQPRGRGANGSGWRGGKLESIIRSLCRGKQMLHFVSHVCVLVSVDWGVVVASFPTIVALVIFR